MTHYITKALTVLLLAITATEARAADAHAGAIFNLGGSDEPSESSLCVSFDTRIDFQNL